MIDREKIKRIKEKKKQEEELREVKRAEVQKAMQVAGLEEQLEKLQAELLVAENKATKKEGK